MVNVSLKISEKLKKKKLLFAAWNATNKNDNPYQNWYLPLKDTLGEVSLFDTAKNYFRHGEKGMQEKLLSLIEQQKPDYLFTIMIYDELDPMFYKEVKKRYPRMIIISLFSDDDWRYEDYSRYYGLFIDYPIVNITDSETDKGYKKDGVKYYSLSLGMNCKLFKPLSIKKRYDVSFVGRPNKSRIDYIRFLLEKDIAVKVWGDGWENYPEVAIAYQGQASAEDLVRITNESKINLSFTQGGYGKLQMKGRIFEAASCKAFTLIERFEIYRKYYQDKKEIVMFTTKEDLLRKIHYYLNHEEERERIAYAAYRRTLKEYNKHQELLSYFKDIISKEKEILSRKLNLFQKKVAVITKDDFYNEKNLRIKVKDMEYVTFTDGGEHHPLQYFLQAYALEKTGKKISCCDAYFSASGLHHYLLFKSKQSSVQDHSIFQKCVQFPQLFIEKEYFIKHLEIFNKFGKFPEEIPTESIAFVSIPLVTLYKVPKISLEDFMKLFQMKFLDKLYSLWYHKKIFYHFFPYCLVFQAFKNKHLRTVLMANLRDKKKIGKVKKGI